MEESMKIVRTAYQALEEKKGQDLCAGGLFHHH